MGQAYGRRARAGSPSGAGSGQGGRCCGGLGGEARGAARAVLPLTVLSLEGCSQVKRRKVSVTQSRLTLCHPMDCSPPGFSVRRILQARVPTQGSSPGLLHCRQIFTI